MMGALNALYSVLAYWAEDYAGTSGETVQRIIGGYTGISCFLAAGVTIPVGYLIDAYGGLRFVYLHSLLWVAILGALVYFPPSSVLLDVLLFSWYPMFTIGMTALWPYLLSRVFPSHHNLGRGKSQCS
jgi:predicted MFS family arabinose efflux permease